MTEIELCILANYPILYVVSPEERRFMENLERICIRNRRNLWTHTISTGLCRISRPLRNEPWQKSKPNGVLDQLKDPIALLEHLKKSNPDEGIFLLIDFQAVLKDPLVQRLLKDLARQFKESHNSIIFLSPTRDLPRSLDHEIYLLDFALPSKGELSTTLESVLNTLEHRQVKIQLENADRERLVNAGQGLTMDEFENCLARAVVKSRGIMDAAMIDEIVASKKQIIKKTGILEFSTPVQTWIRSGGLKI